MKTMIAGLILILALLQYKLWFADGGVNQLWQLKKVVASQEEQNDKLKKNNDILKAEVKNLKHGEEAIEERARNELGMIKKDETYYQVIEKQVKQ